jgi:hypothetical protein
LQYLSDESLEEIKRATNWDIIETNTGPGFLWTEIEKKLNTVHKVASVVKLTARSNYHQMRQGPLSIISYKEHFNHVLQAYKDQNSPSSPT